MSLQAPHGQPTRRAAYTRLTALLLLVTAAAVGLAVLVLAGLGASAATGPLVVLIVVGLVVATTVLSATTVWRPVTDPFPAVPPEPGAETRRFQSISLSGMNLGFSVHIAVDGRHLHLAPLGILQRLGMRPASIPWTALTPLPGSRRRARLGDWLLYAPSWALAPVSGA